MPGLAGGVAHLEHVAQDRAERHALADPMRTGRGADNPEIRLAGDRPGARRGQSLEVLLHFDFSSSLRRRHASVSSIRIISRFEACKGLATFFSSTFSIVMPSTTTVPWTRSTETTLPSRPRNPPRMTRTVSPLRTGRARGRRPFALSWSSADRWEEARSRLTWRGALAARFRCFKYLDDLRTGVVDAFEARALREAAHLASGKALHPATPWLWIATKCTVFPRGRHSIATIRCPTWRPRHGGAWTFNRRVRFSNRSNFWMYRRYSRSMTTVFCIRVETTTPSSIWPRTGRPAGYGHFASVQTFASEGN